MALPSRLQAIMSHSEYNSLIDRESEILRRSGTESIIRCPSVSEDSWETDQSETDSSSTSSTDENLRSTSSEKQKHTNPIGIAWAFEPFALSVKEERFIIKSRHWRPLNDTFFGDYYVAPARYDIKWIQRIFWMSREIRSVLRIISLYPHRFFIKELMKIRNQIYSMSPGNGKRSSLQCKLFSDVYYCLRQCSRLQDDE
jgi:hypothetical protein